MCGVGAGGGGEQTEPGRQKLWDWLFGRLVSVVSLRLCDLRHRDGCSVFRG